MAGLPIDKLGTRSPRVRSTIDPERAKQYAAATNDANPAYESGKYAPPIFGVVPTWEAIGLTVHVDGDQTFRYHEASGDPMPIHLDDNFAKSVGLPGIIAHGLCTMAMTSQAVVTTIADGDPGRIKRLAVRFAKNVFPGDDVTTTIYDLGGGEFGFEATTGRADTVISNGRAALTD